MPDRRTRIERPEGQAQKTIPELVREALKRAGGKFVVGSEIVLPDRGQVMRVRKVNFGATKGRAVKFVWLEWESACIECGAAYTFTSKRFFEYPTRTCPAHRRKRAAQREEAARAVAPPEALREAVGAVFADYALVGGYVPLAEVREAVELRAYGERLPPRGDPRAVGVSFALGDALEQGVAGAWRSADEVGVLF